MIQPVLAIFVALAAATSSVATPEAGDRLPAGFALPDHGGTARSPASLSGPNGLVLVFSRSAGWCPVANHRCFMPPPPRKCGSAPSCRV